MDKTSIETYQNKALRLARARTAAAVISMLLVLAIGYMALHIASRLKTILNEAQSTFTTLNKVAAAIQDADIAGIVYNVNGLVDNAQAAAVNATYGIDQAVSKINELDIQKLNAAIADLSAIAEPLAGLFNGQR
ncbi:MAG: hypothetical protein LBS18_06645 [Clostridiales bacterium]|jgi:hypothetical protein|nr:hypothetical protein [Clostridiales bacterium]